MKVQIGKLVDTMPSLIELANLPMPTPMALRVMRIVKAARPEVETFVELQYKTAKDMKALVDPPGMNFSILDGKKVDDAQGRARRKEWEDAMKPAREAEIELPGDIFTQIDVDTIDRVKPSLLVDLDWLLQL